MAQLTKLFRLLEITRSQPQTGYALAGISKLELSDLAQHHYLVTFIAWRLGRIAQQAGSQINLEKVLEYALIHDLGELMGGDISMPYAMANPEARAAAKRFEDLNNTYLADFFNEDAKHFKTLAKEMHTTATDEALVAKVADYIEVVHYKIYVRRFTKGDITLSHKKIISCLDRMTDKKAAKALRGVIGDWVKDLRHNPEEELFESAKSK